MFGNLLKVVGVGALVVGAAAAVVAMDKTLKASKAAGMPVETLEEKAEKAGKSVKQAGEKIWKKAAKAKQAVTERPARLTGADWCEKGMAFLNDAEDGNNFAKARECFENAHRCGSAEGTRMLAEMYANGYGVEQDRVTSFELYREAAEDGDEESWTQLGVCYAEGVGTEINPEEAFYWFAMAAAAGDETAREILGDLADDITEHVEYPLEVVRDWYERRYGDELSEQEAEQVETFWENCVDEVLELDTDFFAEDDSIFADEEEPCCEPDCCENCCDANAEEPRCEPDCCENCCESEDAEPRCEPDCCENCCESEDAEQPEE